MSCCLVDYFICVRIPASPAPWDWVRPALTAVIQLDHSLPLSRTLSCTHALRSIPILTALPLFVYNREERTEVSRSEHGSPRVETIAPEQRAGGPQMPPFKNPSCSHRLESTIRDTNCSRSTFQRSRRARSLPDRPDNKCRRRDHKCGHRYSRAWRDRVSGSEENPQYVEARRSAIEDLQMTYRVALRLPHHCSVPRSAGEGSRDTPLEDRSSGWRRGCRRRSGRRSTVNGTTGNTWVGS